MYEYQGREGTARVRYLAGKARLKEVDLLGNGNGDASELLTFRPRQIRTLRVEPVK